MDILVSVIDIEFVLLLFYVGKYVGYVIECGKLLIKLYYQVEFGGQFVVSNQIIFNQLIFGDCVESLSVISLLVCFVVVLLKDCNGVIDINLLVSGLLNDFEFSVGGIVWKFIFNLIGKVLILFFVLFIGSDVLEEVEIVFNVGSVELVVSFKLD